MNPVIATLISVLGVSLVSLVGVVALAVHQKLLHKILHFLVSFAVGGLMGDAFIHLLPEAFEAFGEPLSVSLLTIGGLLVFFILEKLIQWHRTHQLNLEDQPKNVGTINLIADGLHNFIDGLLVAASYLVSIPLGFATTIAVVLHEIPQEIGDFAILVHSGFKPNRALAYNFLSAVLAIAGAIVGLVAGGSLNQFSAVMLPVTAGGFIYIAASDLIPELHKQDKPLISIFEVLGMVAGVAVMSLLSLVE